MDAHGQVSFKEGGGELIDSIREMWYQLTLNAAAHSPYFSQHFKGRRFEDRRRELLDKAERGRLWICLAAAGKDRVGYCVSSVGGEGVGEIDSLFVTEAFRGRGVGDELVRRAVRWMGANHARTMIVNTVYGRETVLSFYSRYGFRPKTITLEMVDHPR